MSEEAQFQSVTNELRLHLPGLPAEQARTIAYNVIGRLNRDGFEIEYRWRDGANEPSLADVAARLEAAIRVSEQMFSAIFDCLDHLEASTPQGGEARGIAVPEHPKRSGGHA